MSSNGVYLELLGAFELSYAGCRIPLPSGAQRLLALLAVHTAGVYRGAAAELLWPDCVPSRASANLRTALCHGRRAGPVTAVECVDRRLRLAPVVAVDLHCVRGAAQRSVTDGAPPAEHEDLVARLRDELLPHWPDEWLVLERERWDQLRLHALEALAERLRREGEYLDAFQTALTASQIDPIRETAQRILVEILLAEGNRACAVKRYQEYRRLLRRELAVEPSPLMTRLVQDAISA
ncbi:SARP family transcriptional regulator [Streptomyces sp. SKN60]|uniref:AfsR/SARP family transcriptional regulator n=1 Tax=Streptomyces sp. SKN60 TaxID=2855506 RepID=UPI002245D4F0|nr:BTAD domain-containing putative transcriptional regulator [Streptomyces sp. SKN60]MCX2185541.1 SARP family transcriptional regulator [Streptomyces sp. SKN60]